MAQSNPSIFPLPLSDFEYYMLSDNSIEYPMTFVLRARLTGSLDRPAFTRAVEKAVGLHPLLQSTVRRNWRGAWRWVPNDNTPEILWNIPELNATADAIHFDLTQRNGLRIRMEELRPDEWQATFEFHHSCCDGIGGLNFIGAVFAFYGEQTAATDEELPELSAVLHEQLLRRDKLSTADKSKTCKQARCLSTVVEKIRKMFGRKVNVLAGPVGPRIENQPYPFYITAELSKKDCAAFRSAAKQRQCSVNDLYLQQTFYALQEWNQKQGGMPDAEWIRLGMPVSMRTPCHDGMPACNLVSYVFLSRQGDDLRDENELLGFIRNRTNQALNNRFGHWFLKGLKAIRLVPGLLPLLLKRRQRFSTAIISNVGDLRKSFGARFPQHQGKCIIGNLQLEAMDGVPPVRRGTKLSVSFGTYAGVVTVTLKTDPRQFSAEQSQELLALYMQRLRDLIAEPAQDIDIHRAA